MGSSGSKYVEQLADAYGPSSTSQLSAAYSSIIPAGDESLYAPINYTPGTSSYTAINPNSSKYDGKQGAQDLSGDVIRAQYQDYVNRYQPLENMAIGLISGNGTLDGAYDENRTKASINTSFESSAGQQTRAMERYGLNGTNNINTNSTDKASALVGGINAAKTADEDRRLSLLGGGVSTVATAVRGS